MATAFIQYKNGKGFDIAEDFMQLVFYYIYEELIKSQYSFTKKNLFIMDFESVINGYQSSYLTLGWSEILTNSLEERTMIQILQNVKTSFQSKGIYISVSELQSIPTEDKDFKILYSRNPFPIVELIKIIDTLIKMLEGTWDSNNFSMDINYQY